MGKLSDLQTLRLQELCNNIRLGVDRQIFTLRTDYLTIDSETTAALASALAALPHLVELDLCGNSLPPPCSTAS